MFINRFFLSHIFIIFQNSFVHCKAYPAASTEATTHIVSYVNQRKALKYQRQQKDKKHAGFEEFDFENFRTNLSASEQAEMRGALQQFFGRFVENFDTNLEGLDESLTKNRNLHQSSAENEITTNPADISLDDLMAENVNTLENGFGDNEQHESRKNQTMWHRTKQSIPVLESVRHLVNSVRDGHLNHTEHVQRHRTLVSEMQQMPENTTSMAIETEREREMINASTDLQFLEVVGSIGSRLWGFLKNLGQVFAASASSASTALTASSSSSSSSSSS